MANLASALKEEIARLARKELKGEIEALRKTSAHYRSEIAALKRKMGDIEKSLKGVAKQTVRAANAEEPDDLSKLRFRADGFKAKREALGLSAEATGKFFNVTGQTIYLWETKRTAPRASHMPAIAAFRKLGKRQAQKIVASFNEAAQAASLT